MLIARLHALGLRGWPLQLASLSSIGLCIALWIRAKTVDQEERGNAERRALFAGLWPPTLWLIGESLDRRSAEYAAPPWRRTGWRRSRGSRSPSRWPVRR